MIEAEDGGIGVYAGGPLDLLARFPTIVDRIIDEVGDGRDWDVVRRRYGLRGSEAFTLKDIGLYLGVTRQRVRQLEKRTVETIGQVLRNEHERMAVDGGAAVAEEAGQVLSYLAAPSGRLEPQMRTYFEARYGRPLTSTDVEYLPLLLEALGAKHISGGALTIRSFHGRVWYLEDGFDRERVSSMISSIQRRLEDDAGDVSIFELTVEVVRELDQYVAPEEVAAVVDLLPEIEETPTGGYRRRLHHLPSMARKAERILREAGQPLHYTEIARAINRAHVQAGTKPPVAHPGRLTGQLSQDAAFEPIGRTGSWKLAGWEGVRTEPTAELMAEALVAKGGRCSYDELLAFVRTHRPDTPKSTVYALVSKHDDVFRKLSEGRIELATEGGEAAETENRTSPETVHRLMKDALLALLGDGHSAEMELAEVVRELRSRTGLSDSTIRGRLNRSGWAEVSGPVANRQVVLDLEAIRAEQPAEQGRSAPVTEAVEAAVLDYLEDAADGEARLTAVWDHVKGVTTARRPTFYGIIDGMNRVRKETRSNVTFCVLEAQRENNGRR